MSSYRIDLIRMLRMIELYTHTNPNVRNGGCRVARDYLVEYFEKHPELGNPRDQDPEAHLELLASDPEIPVNFRDDLLEFLERTDYMKIIFGKNNVEDSGEWRVLHWDLNIDDKSIVKEGFTNQQECEEYIKQTVEDAIIWDDRISILRKHKMNSPVFGQEHKVIDVTESIEYNKWQDDETYTVKNLSETFIKENVLGKDLDNEIPKALLKEKQQEYGQFSIYKRLKLVNDPPWGNWWENVEFQVENI